jgi:hypothetical protein
MAALFLSSSIDTLFQRTYTKRPLCDERHVGLSLHIVLPVQRRYTQDITEKEAAGHSTSGCESARNTKKEVTVVFRSYNALFDFELLVLTEDPCLSAGMAIYGMPSYA